MKDFLEYVCEISNKKSNIKLYKTEYSIDVFTGKYSISSLSKSINYTIYRDGLIRYKLIGRTYSFFYESILYNKLLRYRFL